MFYIRSLASCGCVRSRDESVGREVSYRRVNRVRPQWRGRAEAQGFRAAKPALRAGRSNVCSSSTRNREVSWCASEEVSRPKFRATQQLAGHERAHPGGPFLLGHQFVDQRTLHGHLFVTGDDQTIDNLELRSWGW